MPRKEGEKFLDRRRNVFLLSGALFLIGIVLFILGTVH